MQSSNLPAKAPDLALLTDLYELTMAYGYWKTGTMSREAVFHVYFRHNPFKGGFSVACGLADAVAYLRGLSFSEADREYLGAVMGSDGKPIFEQAFIDFLGAVRWECDVDAIPEGTIVFPQEPLMRIQGPLYQCQIVETALLNILNFQTLIATKAARVCYAAGGDPVLEFGLRRAQGNDGGLTASRAAYIGGCTATSNVLAGQRFGIPVSGTHAHSWVMAFDSEEESFRAYAEAMPNNCVFLVDTYDTIEGVRHAIREGLRLRAKGHEMVGIRLDSGDLAYLSIESRRLLDEAGFPNARIVASNDLDEYTILSLKHQGARIDSWGVGTRLVTGYDQPALGGVYKLAAIKGSDGRWEHRVKLSEQAAKISTPGLQQIRRYTLDDLFIGDMLYDLAAPDPQADLLIDPLDETRQKQMPPEAEIEDLLLPVFRKEELVGDQPTIHEIRERTFAQMNRLHDGVKRFLNPHEYPVGLSPALHRLRTELIREARATTRSSSP